MTILAKRAVLLVICVCLASCSKHGSETGGQKASSKAEPKEEAKPVASLSATALFHDFVSQKGEKLKGNLVEIRGTVMNRVFEPGGMCIQIAVADAREKRHIRCFFEDQELASIRRIVPKDEISIKGICGDEIKFDQFIEFKDCKLTKGPPIK